MPRTLLRNRLDPSLQDIFFDDFSSGSIDPEKWSVYDRISDQVNGELNCVVPANVSVSGGILSGISKFEGHTCGDTIQAPEAMDYTSWQIAQKTAPFLYGTVEVRAKIPGGTGAWPCIWMLGFEWQASQPFTANTPEHNWPVGGWCEVDIAEFMNNARSEVNNQVHFGTANVGPGIKALPFDATTQFAVYRLQWSAGSMIWSVNAEDGKGYQQLSSLSGSNVPDVAMYLIIHVAVGGFAVGAPNSATFPVTMNVDWVRISR